MRYFLAFGGGAVRGMAYTGAVKALREFDIEPAGFAGSSVGAVFAAFCAVMKDFSEFDKLFFDFNAFMFKDVNFSVAAPDFAISKGDIFENWVREIIERSYYEDFYTEKNNIPVKFADLESNLYIYATDLKTNKRIVFSKETTPTFEVAKAVRISAGFPGLMVPVEYDGMLLVDGDISKPYPLWTGIEAVNSPDVTVLEFRLEGCRDCFNPKNVLDYFNSVYSSFSNFCTAGLSKLYDDKEKYNIIVIDTKDVMFLDFMLSEEKRKILAKTGYDTVSDFLTRRLPEKNGKFAEIYKNLTSGLKEIKNLIKLGGANDFKVAVADFLTMNSEELKLVEENFTARVENLFKEIFEKGVRKSFFRIRTVRNREEYSAKVSELIDYCVEKQSIFS